MHCFLHKIGQALNISLQSDTVHLDLSKAFDTVSHDNVLHKLEAGAVRGQLLLWLKEYLSTRSQLVLATSSPLPVTSKVFIL